MSAGRGAPGFDAGTLAEGRLGAPPPAPAENPKKAGGAAAHARARPDVLLTHGYFLAQDPREQLIMKPYVPLGILYISAWLKRAGFSVEIFDSTFQRFEDLASRLRAGPPSIVGIYANLMTRKNCVELARIAKESGWIVVAGGPEPASYPEEYLGAGADVIVEGEGEATMEALIPALSGLKADPERLSKVAGIIFRGAGGRIQKGPHREAIASLDLTPWPDRGAVDVHRYVETWRRAHGTGSVSLITARGCPFRCNWCSHGVFGLSHRRRSVRSVVEEIEFLRDQYRPDMLWFADDVFTIKHSWLFELHKEMKARRIRIPFECITRADRMNEEVTRALAELGCFRVWIGSESGSQRILDAMERGVTVEEVQNAVALARRYGIQTGLFLMWGYEGEELSDIEATVEHVKVSNPDVFLTTVAYPIKGTPYFEKVAGKASLPVLWDQSSDREIEIRGRHSRRFYAAATKYLEREVALARLLQSHERGARILEIGRTLVSAKAARLALRLREREVERA